MAPLGPVVLSAGKKAALASLGLFTGVGGAVAYQLDQVAQQGWMNLTELLQLSIQTGIIK